MTAVIDEGVLAKCWVEDIHGGAIDLLDCDPRQWDLDAIAQQLAKIPRWCGAVGNIDTTYSVAEHSLIVMWIGFDLMRKRGLTRHEDWAAYAVLHDAHEIVTSDIPSPVSRAIAALAGWDVLGVIKRRLQAAIHARFGLDDPMPEIAALLHEADEMALALERHHLKVPSQRAWTWTPRMPPVDIRIACWPARQAAQEFLRVCTHYGVGE